jgi:hypothetical protein
MLISVDGCSLPSTVSLSMYIGANLIFGESATWSTRDPALQLNRAFSTGNLLPSEMDELRHRKHLDCCSAWFPMLMHGAEGGKGISYDKATHGKVSEVFFEQVAKSRRQG